MELGNIPLSRHADVHASLQVDFTAIKTRYPDFRHAVPGRAGNVFGVALRDLDALLESRETRTWIAALEASGAE